MNKIWANCLIRGTQTWDAVPAIRIAGVKSELQTRVKSGVISAEQYETITGEAYEPEE